MILDDGAVKAFGTYDELRRSGVDINDFVVRATEEELAEELNNAAQIVEKNSTNEHNKDAADGKSLMREVMVIASIFFFPLSSLSLSLFLLFSLSLVLFLPSLSTIFLILLDIKVSLSFLLDSMTFFFSLSLSLSLTLSLHLTLSVFPVIPTAEVAVTGKKSTVYFCVEFIIIAIR